MLDLTPEKARIFRIAHIANLAWILANGVHCRSSPMQDDGLKHSISFVFTDRHAYLQAAEFFRDLADLDRVDWKILQARDFRRDPNDPGKLERYEAEALVHRHVPVSVLKGIVCHGPEEETTVRQLVQNAGIQMAVAA